MDASDLAAAKPGQEAGAPEGSPTWDSGLEWVALSAIVLSTLLVGFVALFKVSWPRIPLSGSDECLRVSALGLLAFSLVASRLAGRRRGEGALDVLLASHLACALGAFLALQLKGITALRALLAWEFITCMALLIRSYSARPRPWKSALLGLATLVLVSQVVLLLGEIVLRVLMASSTPARWPCISYGNTSWKMVALYDGEKNSVGLRERELSEFKPPGFYRVLFVGDSVTFGLGIPREETFVKRVEQSLDARARKEGLRFETINGGWPGFNTRQEFEIIRQKGLYYEPDLVLMVFFPNDIEEVGNVVPYQGVCRMLDPLYENSLAWTWGSRQVHSAAERLGLCESYAAWLHRQYESECMRELEQYLYNSQVWARRYGKRFGIVIFPFMEDLRRYGFTDIHEKVRKVAAAHGIPCLDLLPAFAGLEDAPMQLSPAFDHHPSARAHAVAAGPIEGFILAFLKAAPPSPAPFPASTGPASGTGGTSPPQR